MKRMVLILVLTTAFIFGLAMGLFAQQKGKVSGMIVDTAANTPVAGVTISILSKKDSSLVSFTMTGSDGRFALTGLPMGEFRMMATHVNFHNVNRHFTLTAEKAETCSEQT